MKQIWPLFCLALMAAPLAAPTVAWAEASDLRGGLGEAVMLLADNKKDRDGRWNSGGNRQRGEVRRDDDRPAPPERQQSAPAQQRFERPRMQENRDDRINRAMSVAGQRGRVLDAGPQGGSVFWVRVATDHGRVDLLVDADSGHIIGER